MTDETAASQSAPAIHSIAFRARGMDYFRLWIVNIALGVLTLGIYSAWGAVRARRYFAANTFLDEAPFAFHGKAWPVLARRIAGTVLVVLTAASGWLVHITLVVSLPLLAAAFAALRLSALRYEARNTSWRGERFAFGASYREAVMALVVWPLLGILPPLLPYARRVYARFWINDRSFGGEAFRSEYPPRRIYVIYLLGFILLVGVLIAVLAGAGAVVVLATRLHNVLGAFSIPLGPDDFSAIVMVLFGTGALFIANAVLAMDANLRIGSTVLGEQTRLTARLSPVAFAWIAVSNLALILVTLGLFWPFARVRMARYRMGRFGVDSLPGSGGEEPAEAPRRSPAAALERAWPAMLAALVVVLALAAYAVVQVVPLATEWLALRTRPAVAHMMTEQTLLALDRAALWPSTLTPQEQAKATALFGRMAARRPGGIGAYRLVFRNGGMMGANAFALPDGTVVLTDQLWARVKSDAEIEGVFAAEMSHADHGHQLQRVYAAAPWRTAMMVLTGDMSEVSEMTAVLPGIIVNGRYTTSAQEQADDDAAAALRAAGEHPAALAGLIERLHSQLCTRKGCPRSWAGTGPVAGRAARLRRQDTSPLPASEDCRKPWNSGISLHCLGLD